MKKQFDIKKLVLLNLPYLLMGLFTTNFGEAWRLAQGANASEKFLSLFAVNILTERRWICKFFYILVLGLKTDGRIIRHCDRIRKIYQKDI